MKTRFSTFDIVCSVTELQKLIGMRVNNIYDIDNKTYLIRLQRTEEKAVLLLESGNRFHTTAFEWPKNIAPSGFSMKMRKHLKNKRLEYLKQVGSDRILDLQFGQNEAAYHIIVELYDRGNLILTDHEMTILYILRPFVGKEEVRFAVKEKYLTDRARNKSKINRDEIKQILTDEIDKKHFVLKKALVPHLEFGPALIEHALLEAGFGNNVKLGKDVDVEKDLDKIIEALENAERIMETARTTPLEGYIIQKKEERLTSDLNKEYYFSNQEFHPMLFKQHSSLPHKKFDTFDMAADEFYSTLESQKIDLKAIHQEREALKKLDNVKKDHSQRLEALTKDQEVDKKKAELITRNQNVVDNAILAIQSALASQMSWPDIENLVKSAQSQGDPTASLITKLKLEVNHITLFLSDPYASGSDSEEENDDKLKPMHVDIDLGLSAFANARKYYDKKRSAAIKQQKTIDAHGKALKSAEKKTKQTLKEVQTITSINKARKVYWFEKFFWFITSENYLVIGGRDQQQNEIIVKRYMKSNDVYVHADVHGAASVVVKNSSDQPIPPKTLNEAGTMAICYSVAWEAKVVTSAWWVFAHQVSKTAPTGEYLTTGSFMIRGKKNYLPPCHLVMGLGFLFKLEDDSVFRHKDERRVKGVEEDEVIEESKDEEEVVLDEEEVVLDESDEDEEKKLEKICEETGDANDEANEDEDGINKEVKDDVEDEDEDEVVGQEKSDDESDSDSDDGKPHFPDTQIKIQHFAGTKINVLAEPVTPSIEDDDSETVVFLGDDKPIILKPPQRSRGSSESKTKNKEQKRSDKNDEDAKIQQQKQVKRGQKGKLKKIKEKYKDQDDEERKLRMEILQSSGRVKDSKKSRKKQEQERQMEKQNMKKQPKVPKQVQRTEGDEDETDDVQVATDVDMIDALTGIPNTEDELLFSVPVVAPYNTLTNYKYKVKLTPGTGKRGKAAKTALNMFLKDRSSTQREKDLMKSVKDENLARNLPGKVKLSAPKLQTLKK